MRLTASRVGAVRVVVNGDNAASGQGRIDGAVSGRVDLLTTGGVASGQDGREPCGGRGGLDDRKNDSERRDEVETCAEHFGRCLKSGWERLRG